MIIICQNRLNHLIKPTEEHFERQYGGKTAQFTLRNRHFGRFTSESFLINKKRIIWKSFFINKKTFFY